MKTLFERRCGLVARGARTAFTLVELLVVISILALLVSLLLPALGRVRDQAELAACLSNMRQTGVALGLFLADNRGVLPADYYENRQPENSNDWWGEDDEGRHCYWYQLAPYLNNDFKVWQCPTAMKFYENRGWPRHIGYDTNIVASTTVNMLIYRKAATTRRWHVQAGQVRNMHEFGLFFDGVGMLHYGRREFCHSNNWNNPNLLFPHGGRTWWDGSGISYAGNINYHSFFIDGKATMTRVDGSATSFTLNDLNNNRRLIYPDIEE